MTQATQKILQVLADVRRTHVCQDHHHGLLAYGDGRGASVTIMVSDGRVGWAASNARYLRLSHRLVAAAGDRLSADALSMVQEACEHSGRYLGEWLLDRGILDEQVFNRCLVEHTLAAMSDVEPIAAPVWTPVGIDRIPRHLLDAARLRQFALGGRRHLATVADQVRG